MLFQRLIYYKQSMHKKSNPKVALLAGGGGWIGFALLSLPLAQTSSFIFYSKQTWFEPTPQTKKQP